MIKIVECPRDAMQGIKTFIPTEEKAAYLNALLKVGFHSLDFGSFVSPKAIPQMRDTAELLDALDLDGSRARLLAIVANRRGAEEAAVFEQIGCLGYPFSISETFQLRNTNATIDDSLALVDEIQSICQRTGKELVLYLSMGFGNPYGDPWSVDIVQGWVDRFADRGIRILSLSDTVGMATPETVAHLFGNLIPPYPEVEFGAHLHTRPENWREKIEAAYAHGCKRFDAALKGFGGCPMAKDDLTGNMPTENLLAFFTEKGEDLRLDRPAFDQAMQIAADLFAKYA
jgi:hydroxymethylglutaryl-CoA lyase